MRGLDELIEEPAGGPNHGRRASSNPEAEGRHLPLDAEEWQTAEFLRAGGWTAVEAGRGRERGGDMTAHRGVLHPDEYVDACALQEKVERELGFTYEAVHSVYRQGPLGPEQRGLRSRIDARLLALSRSGANVALLGRTLGFPVKDNGNCRAMENALARARAEEAA